MFTGEGILGARRRLIASRRELGMEGRGVPFGAGACHAQSRDGEGDRVTLERDIRAALDSGRITGPVRMIVLDTVRRSMPGKSGNQSRGHERFGLTTPSTSRKDLIAW